MRPYTICHMMASLDGRIDCDMTEQIDDTNHYYEALEIIRRDFGVGRLAVVGGGHINGSMLDLGLIDEVSMMYGYGIDGRAGLTAAFDGRPKNCKPVRLTFKSVEEQDGIVWMRYQVGGNK